MKQQSNGTSNYMGGYFIDGLLPSLYGLNR